MAYEVRISEEAMEHLRRLPARERTTILRRVGSALKMNPSEETRNLKALRPNPLASFELRIGSFRVFYEIDEDRRQVWILAMGRKEHNRLWIGDEEVSL